jgi:hypothetical protein
MVVFFTGGGLSRIKYVTKLEASSFTDITPKLSFRVFYQKLKLKPSQRK